MLDLITKNLFMEWVDGGKNFTLYDITKELRNRGNWIDHADTKHYLDEYLNDLSKYNYKRELKTFSGGYAYVYSPIQNMDVQDSVSKDNNIIIPNKDNRLRLLSRHLKKINAQPNQTFAINYGRNSITIQPFDNPSVMADKFYTVETKNTLRIKNKDNQNVQYKVEMVNGDSLKLVKI